MAHFDNATAQAIMNEALKYQGWKYVYGGSNPNTSFDCGGLVQWCYGKVGISLPRTAQAQYDATQHLPLSQAKAGDLVFFHSTYNAGSYVTHVGILVSPTQMYHAGGFPLPQPQGSGSSGVSGGGGDTHSSGRGVSHPPR